MLNKGSGIRYPWVQRKIDKVYPIIEEWLHRCDYQAYCSISGGKDSLVAADLIRHIYPDIPLVWINQGYLAEWPDCVELIRYWQNEGQNVVELCPSRDLWHLYLDLGVPLEGTMDTAADKIINKRLMYDPLNEYQERNDINGYAWGIRRSESKGRAMYIKRHGMVHQNKKDGLIVCSPVANFTTQEVWQYIDMKELLYPAMYDRDRLTVRNGPPIGTTGINWGRMIDLRKHHPDIFAKFADKFPEVLDFV